MRKKRSTPVYSTRTGGKKRCPRCNADPCHCPAVRSLPPEQQEAHIRREKKGRGGKTVTVIYNLRLTKADLKALGKRLRRACGAGGTAKEARIEVQGDHRERVVSELEALGYKVKLTGG